MDDKIDTVRRGLEIADAFCGKHTADECPDTVAIPIKSALSALSAIDPEDNALKVGRYFCAQMPCSPTDCTEVPCRYMKDAIANRNNRDPEAIRRECADRMCNYCPVLTDYAKSKCSREPSQCSYRDAIINAEKDKPEC